MTCFNTRHEARASLLVRAHALNGQRRHRNQQSYKNIWFDATSVKACMWRKECDPRPEECVRKEDVCGKKIQGPTLAYLRGRRLGAQCIFCCGLR